MKRCSTAELRKLEIINLCDGSRLGYANELEFDKTDARILSLVISGKSGFCGFGESEDLVIPWQKIECFGEDTILVRLSQHEYASCLCQKEGRGKGKRFPF